MQSYVLLFSLALTALSAHALDRQDAGDYVLLNAQQQPTAVHMRYMLQDNGQWIMDGKTGNEDWRPVCRGDGECRLVAASQQEIDQWKKLLPSQWQAHSFSCIRNVAFAFCRASEQDNAQHRAYWWFSLIHNRVHAFPIQRLAQ